MSHPNGPARDADLAPRRDSLFPANGPAQDADEIKKTMASRLRAMETNSSPEDAQRRHADLEGFTKLFDCFMDANNHEQIDWHKIQDLPPNAIVQYSSLATPTNTDDIKKMLQSLVVVKLNGGLGTSMGCQGPKSLIEVRDGMTFLDLAVNQIKDVNEKYDVDVPLVLMNSFNTDSQTAAVLENYTNSRVSIETFEQSCFPRIQQRSLMPTAKTCNVEEDKESWYPPGHGDFFKVFRSSGKLKKFVEQGKKVVFVSNIDNTGATVDLGLLSKAYNGTSFIMEMSQRTPLDVKGGTLIWYEDHASLLEVAQVPKDKRKEFMDIEKFRVFNTNNIWMSLPDIEEVCKKDSFQLNIIKNPKVQGGVGIFQLETAIGAAMRHFKDPLGVQVSRDRFLPVKTTTDLFFLKSVLYELSGARLKRRSDTPLPTVSMDDSYKRVADFARRIPSMPNIDGLKKLQLAGEVVFGSNVTLRGNVILEADKGGVLQVPDGFVLEDVTIQGQQMSIDT